MSIVASAMANTIDIFADGLHLPDKAFLLQFAKYELKVKGDRPIICKMVSLGQAKYGVLEFIKPMELCNQTCNRSSDLPGHLQNSCICCMINLFFRRCYPYCVEGVKGYSLITTVGPEGVACIRPEIDFAVAEIKPEPLVELHNIFAIGKRNPFRVRYTDPKPDDEAGWGLQLLGLYLLKDHPEQFEVEGVLALKKAVDGRTTTLSAALAVFREMSEEDAENRMPVRTYALPRAPSTLSPVPNATALLSRSHSCVPSAGVLPPAPPAHQGGADGAGAGADRGLAEDAAGEAGQAGDRGGHAAGENQQGWRRRR